MLKAKVKRRERQDKEKALEELSQEETTRLNAEIPTSLHQSLKLYSVKSKKTMTEITVEAIITHLNKYSNE